MRNILKRAVAVILAAFVMMGVMPAQTVEASTMKIPTSAKEFNGHFYKVYHKDDITWTSAKQKCEALGGHLVTITSANEAEFVGKLPYNNEYGHWIGAYSSKGKWKWVKSENSSFTPYQGWPNAYDYPNCCYCPWNEDLAGERSGNTNDYYICEWDTPRDEVLPDQVSFTSVKKADSSTVVLSWKKVNDAKGYAIYMKKGKNGTFTKIKDIKSKNTTTYIKSNLKKNNTYYFRIRAYKTIYGERSYGDLSVIKSIKLK